MTELGDFSPVVAGTEVPFEPETHRRIVDVVFDVSVEATSGQGNTGKVGVIVATIGLGTQRRTETTDKAVHKIQFSVPMVLPIMVNNWQENNLKLKKGKIGLLVP